MINGEGARPVYQALFAAARRLDAERAHQWGFAAIRAGGQAPLVVAALRRVCGVRDPALPVHAMGLDFPNPLGVAAGFDKDAQAVRGLAALGFGFVEVGTVTAVPQPGNARPRLHRLPADRAIVNRMGFNNAGAEAVARRLRRQRQRPDRPVVGVNIGKSRVVPDEHAVVDYVASTRRLAAVADYLVVNVSSPNTPGLRDLQAVHRLDPLLSAVRAAAEEAAGWPVPVLVKISPDLADDHVLAVADVAVDVRLAGIVATNTTASRDGLTSTPAEVAAAGAGGLSGDPLRKRSLEVLRLLHSRVGDRLTLVSVGGVSTAQDAWERLQAGARLVQAYTGLVYGGPLWPGRVIAGLAELARGAGRG